MMYIYVYTHPKKADVYININILVPPPHCVIDKSKWYILTWYIA